jgi:hypothetical protein
MPGGEVRRYGVEADDSMWHLHNMFLSHSEYGDTKGGMMILPTYNGFFELDNIIEKEDEHVRGKDTGRLLLRKYGMRQRDNVITLLFFPQYKRQYLPSLFKGFYNQNVEVLLTKDLQVFPELYYLPEDLSQDLVQNDLKLIFERHYMEQRLHYKAKIRQREIEFSARIHQKGVDLRQKNQDVIKENEKRLRLEERRIESQLKGLEGEEREAKRKMLMARLLERNQQVISDSAADEARIRLAKRQTRLETLRTKRLARRAADAGPTLMSVKEGEEEDNVSEDPSNDGMDEEVSIDDDAGSQDTPGTLNTKVLNEISSSQMSHVMASGLKGSIDDLSVQDEHASDVSLSLSEASKDTLGLVFDPSTSIIIDPSLTLKAGSISSAGSAEDNNLSHVMALNLAESLKIGLSSPGATGTSVSVSTKKQAGDNSSANSRSSTLRKKFKHVSRDKDIHDMDSDASSVVSDVSDLSGGMGQGTGQGQVGKASGKTVSRDSRDFRPPSSRGEGSDEEDGRGSRKKPSSLAGLDLSRAGPERGSEDGDQVSVASISDEEGGDGKSLVSMTSDTSEGSKINGKVGKLSRKNSDNSLLSDGSSVGFHDNQSAMSAKSGLSLSRSLSKQESFIFKKYEVTSIQDHNVKASILGHARMKSTDLQSTDLLDTETDDHSSVPNALKSSSVSQPGIMVSKKIFEKKDSYKNDKMARNSILVQPPDNVVSFGLQPGSPGNNNSNDINNSLKILSPSPYKKVSGVYRDTSSDADNIASTPGGSSSDESKDSRADSRAGGKKKKGKHKSRHASRGASPPSSDEEGRASELASASASASKSENTSTKKKKKKKGDKVGAAVASNVTDMADEEPRQTPKQEQPLRDMHEHTRGISVKKPYSTGYSSKLLKPIAPTDKRAMEIAALSNALSVSAKLAGMLPGAGVGAGAGTGEGEGTANGNSKKLDPMAEMAAKTYESTFMRFLNPAFRRSHKKT